MIEYGVLVLPEPTCEAFFLFFSSNLWYGTCGEGGFHGNGLPE